MKMLTNLNLPSHEDAPGFVLSIIGKPQDDEDLRIIEWALSTSLHQVEETRAAENISDVVELCFDLPYQQGAGFVEVYLHRRPIGHEDRNIEEPTWVEPPAVEPRFTGNWIRIGYADSMTNIFVSPIYATEDGFITEDY